MTPATARAIRAFILFFILPVLGIVLLVAFSSGPQHHVAPAPAPFSCSQLNKSIAPVDGGRTIAPVCGNIASPPNLPPDNG